MLGHLKQTFVNKRKLFDKNVQSCKRAQWLNVQKELLSLAETNSKYFWKSMGRSGVRDNRNNDVPLKVIDSNGVLTRDKNIVFENWKLILVIYIILMILCLLTLKMLMLTCH